MAETVQEQHSEEPRGLTPAALLLALALILSLMTFATTVRFSFVYDDLPQIVSNPAVKSWNYAVGYFLHHVWSHIYPTWPGNYYRPLFLLWLLVNHTLFGLQPLGWHATTVLAHGGVTLMVYWLARRLTGDSVTAAIAALLFGVHPAHIECVAWISGVSEPLLALLFIPAFVFYMDSTRAGSDAASRQKVRSSTVSRAWSLAFYALALLSKETAVVLPALIFGYEWLRDSSAEFGTRLRRSLLAMVPYAVVTLAYLGARSYALKGVVHPDANVGPGTVLLTFPLLLWWYFRHLAWPWPVSIFYDVPYVFTPGLGNFVLPLAAVSVVAAALWLWSRRSRVAAIASLWLLVPILPPLGSIGVFASGEIAHDRYLYLPSIGFCILVAMLLRRLRLGSSEFLGLPAAQSVAVLVLGGVMAGSSGIQSRQWASDLLLYNFGVQTAPHNSLARSHLGTEMLARGDTATALRLYHEAYELAPDAWTTNFILGFTYFNVGRPTEAEPWLRRAIRITPANPNQYLYLGLTLLELNRLDEAEANVRHAVELWPNGAGYHYGLGLVEQRKGNLEAARDAYREELRVDPTSGARGNLAEVEKQLAGPFAR